MCLRHLRRVSADDATTFGWVNSIPAFLHILMSAMTPAKTADFNMVNLLVVYPSKIKQRY